jgi:UDP-2,4-diacetamido-2,4,6-trideoxy-beta-L-altropyranose hydrolase
MDKKKIFFRADGDQTIGMGHFTRTLALTEMLNNYFYCVFATQKPSEYQINEIAKVCHQRIDLPNDETHFSFFLNLLQGTEISQQNTNSKLKTKVVNLFALMICTTNIF